MPSPEEPEIRRLALRIARIVEERYGIPPKISEIYAALELFARYNPGADPEAIDWSIWDPRLPLEIMLERLEEAYPEYSWRPPSPPIKDDAGGEDMTPPPTAPMGIASPRPRKRALSGPGAPRLGITGAGGCALGYGYYRHYMSGAGRDKPGHEGRHHHPRDPVPVREGRAGGWRGGLLALYKVFLLMIALLICLLLMALSRDALVVRVTRPIRIMAVYATEPDYISTIALAGVITALAALGLRGVEKKRHEKAIMRGGESEGVKGS